MTVQDWGEGASALSSTSAWQTALLGAGAVLGSALLDRSVSRSVDRHFGSRALDTLDGFGKWLPVAALGGAGLAALSEQDRRVGSTRTAPNPAPSPRAGPPPVSINPPAPRPRGGPDGPSGAERG